MQTVNLKTLIEAEKALANASRILSRAYVNRSSVTDFELIEAADACAGMRGTLGYYIDSVAKTVSLDVQEAA